MAIGVVKLSLFVLVTHLLYPSVEGAMIHKRHHVPQEDRWTAAALVEQDSPETSWLSPVITIQVDLPALSLPPSTQAVLTGTPIDQYNGYPILSTPPAYIVPTTITSPPVTPTDIAVTQSPPVTPTDIAVTQSPPQTACTPWASGCNIFYQYVNVNYLPVEGHNTDCLSSISSAEPDAFQPFEGPSLEQWESSSVVIVFPTLRASDGCQGVGQTHYLVTHTFDLTQLSTVRENDPNHYNFNIMDFPCPPASVGYTKDLPYQPMVVPPTWFLTDLDSAWKTCTPAWGQGIDPPTALPTARDASGQDAGKFLGLPPGGG